MQYSPMRVNISSQKKKAAKQIAPKVEKSPLTDRQEQAEKVKRESESGGRRKLSRLQREHVAFSRIFARLITH